MATARALRRYALPVTPGGTDAWPMRAKTLSISSLDHPIEIDPGDGLSWYLEDHPNKISVTPFTMIEM